ncbi:hypothetical protein F2P44_10075 [Massilia sp. CCM 8695]|uniref:Uncharacterized protein n=1 Tax=Massilia frigida TaxID=2609281 RepID=A0ABX0N2S9_9BURK|nr:hypothetical protein [Massilia frigida]NHZ79623.1 hypothetical protein [Massilia frigida]
MSTFGRDTPMERPNPGGRAAVFVPKVSADDAVKEKLKNGSGMVGFGNSDGSVTVYFENNRFNDSSLHKWASKVWKSYGRMVELSPTVNKLVCDASNLTQVGFVQGPEIEVRDMPLLLEWLERTSAADSAPEGPLIHA